MIFVFRRIGFNYIWNLILISVPYYCFTPPRRGGAFSGHSLAHPQLVHISESVFCKETPASLWNFAIFLPKILVYKFHLLKNFQYLYLYLCFINSTSWEFCNRIFQYSCLWSWFIKFDLLKHLQYLCLYFCFINLTSWDFCNRILQYFWGCTKSDGMDIYIKIFIIYSWIKTFNLQ